MTRSSRLTLTNLLILLNVLAYGWEAAAGGPDIVGNLINGPQYFTGALYGPEVTQGAWWLVVTGAFLHGNLVHLGVNMFALHILGNDVETLYGRTRFAVLYALALVGSGVAVLAFNYGVPTLGASGAIYGLFGAEVAIGLRLGARGRGLIGRVMPTIVLNLIITFAIPGISIAGHIGGLITGLVVGFLLFLFPSRQRNVAYAYVLGPPVPVAAAEDVEPAAESAVETIAAPPHAGPHEELGEPIVRDPRE